MKDYIMTTKASHIIRSIDQRNDCLPIALKKFDTSENYASKIIRNFERLGLLYFYKIDNNTKYFRLTKSGEEVKKNFIIIESLLSRRKGKKGL